MAYMILRVVVANTIYNFDIEAAPGTDIETIVRQRKNLGILKAGPLQCVFKEVPALT